MRIHSILSPKCFVKSSVISGKGVFAADAFEEGEMVAIWGGKIYSSDEIETLSRVFPHFQTHTVSVCPGYYLGTENLFEFDDAEFFNHSCEANIGIKGQIILVARKTIKAGEELTFDYDTTEILAEPFHCFCGKRTCRGIIDGTGWKNDGFIKNNLPYLSWYIQNMVKGSCQEKIFEEI
jgi:SET domain-containing protein